MRRKIYCTSECNGYWYHARHGVGPGTIPRDVHLLKVVEDPENSWKDYFLLDRALTSDELAEYDLKEKCPPQIEASTSIKASQSTSRELLLSVPEIQYYEKLSPEEEEEAFSYMNDQDLEEMGYSGYHIIGWYALNPKIDEILSSSEYSETMLVDDGEHKFLGYVVGGRLYELEEDEIGDQLDHSELPSLFGDD